MREIHKIVDIHWTGIDFVYACSYGKYRNLKFFHLARFHV